MTMKKDTPVTIQEIIYRDENDIDVLFSNDAWESPWDFEFLLEKLKSKKSRPVLILDGVKLSAKLRKLLPTNVRVRTWKHHFGVDAGIRVIEWHDVRNMLPKYRGEYLVFIPRDFDNEESGIDDTFQIAWFDENGDWLTTELFSQVTLSPTHWAHLKFLKP